MNVEAKAEMGTEKRRINAETEVEVEVVIEADIATRISETKAVKVMIKAEIARE